MITRPITRPITSPIARAVTAHSSIWNPRALFALGEQGVIYDPSDLSTLWQEAAGTTPVTAAGQPVGLMLDKRLGLVLGSELVVNGEFVENALSWSATTATLTWLSGALQASSAGVGGATSAFFSTIPGRRYVLKARLLSTTAAAGVRVFDSGTSVIYETGYAGAREISASFVATTSTTQVYLRNSAAGVSVWDSVSVKELPGNHAFQTTASAKPFVRDTPRRIDYDADDSLGITFPSALGAACTVARSIPGVGAQILTAQTIGTSYTLNVDSCADVIINRALTPTETANLTRYLNQRAGV